MSRVVRGRRDRCEEGLDERPEIVGELVGREAGPALAGVRIHDGEVDLRLVSIEVEEEFIDLVHDVVRARVRPSTLFTTRTTFSRASSALRSTNLVCGK